MHGDLQPDDLFGNAVLNPQLHRYGGKPDGKRLAQPHLAGVAVDAVVVEIPLPAVFGDVKRGAADALIDIDAAAFARDHLARHIKDCPGLPLPDADGELALQHL